MDGFMSKSNKSYISYYYEISYISDKFRGRILSANPIPQKMEHFSFHISVDQEDLTKIGFMTTSFKRSLKEGVVCLQKNLLYLFITISKQNQKELK